MKSLPTDSKTIFLLCEDFRSEQGGKATLLGAFLGGDIIIQGKKEQGLALPSLTFIFIFNDGSGVFTSKVSILSPENKELVPEANSNQPEKKPESNQPEKKPEQPMSIIFKIAPFPALEGTYKVRALLDEKPYEREFKIIYMDKPS